MKTSTLKRISNLTRYTLVTMSLLYILFYLVIVFFRIQYPFQLEWMEGGSLDQVRRILYGQKLYVRPSLEFVPYIYTPFYIYLSALMAKILGVGFMPLRLLSFLSSLGCFIIIFLIVHRETASKFSALMAVGLFSATFRTSGAWLDIARSDSLFLFLLLTALYLIKFKTSLKTYALAGVFISLAFLTKQTAIIMAFPLLLYSFWEHRRGFLWFLSTLVAIIGLSTWGLNLINEGWYTYYVFHLARQHSFFKSQLVYFWINDIIAPVFIAVCMSTCYLYSRFSSSTDSGSPKNPDEHPSSPRVTWKRPFEYSPQGLFYLLAAIGMIGIAWLGRLNLGSYKNVLLPAYAFISILFGLAIHAALEFLQKASIKNAPPGLGFLENPHKIKLVEICIYLNCIIQFAVLIYNPWALVPTRQDLKAGNELVQTIKKIEGEVLIPSHNYLLRLAGKNSYAHEVAIADVLGDFGGRREAVKIKLFNEITLAIKEKRFAAIIMDNDSDWFIKYINKYYIKQRLVFDNEKVFWTVAGMTTRPQFLYVPKDHDRS